MVDTSWFDDLPEDFEESVRIDRDEQDHRQRAIRSYHMTADSRRFIEDFVDRMLGQSDDMRTDQTTGSMATTEVGRATC